jgi:NitT/TauT family transport system permease protein
VNQAWLRKVFILVVIAAGWQLYALQLNNPLLVPTFTATIEAFWTAMMNGDLPQKVANSVLLLLKGYAIGLALAMLFTALAMMSKIGNDLLETLTSAFNPLPAIALLPLALIWFGLGEISIIFVLVHSVLWAVALNTHWARRRPTCADVIYEITFAFLRKPQTSTTGLPPKSRSR